MKSTCGGMIAPAKHSLRVEVIDLAPSVLSGVGDGRRLGSGTTCVAQPSSAVSCFFEVAQLKRLREKKELLVAPLRCAPAFGRVELFIFHELTAQLKLCPSKRS